MIDIWKRDCLYDNDEDINTYRHWKIWQRANMVGIFVWLSLVAMAFYATSYGPKDDKGFVTGWAEALQAVGITLGVIVGLALLFSIGAWYCEYGEKHKRGRTKLMARKSVSKADFKRRQSEIAEIEHKAYIAKLEYELLDKPKIERTT